MNGNPDLGFLNSLFQDQNPGEEVSNEAAEAMERERMEVANMVKRALIDNPDGAMLLDYLVNATIMTPMMMVNKAVPIVGEVAMSPADWAYCREGQNSVVHWMREQIQISLNPPQSQQQDQDNG